MRTTLIEVAGWAMGCRSSAAGPARRTALPLADLGTSHRSQNPGYVVVDLPPR